MSIGVQALIYSSDKKKILLIKRADFPFWTLPGGRKEKKETIYQTLRRETLEETGLKIIQAVYVKAYRVWYLPLIGVTHVYICRRFIGNLKAGIEAREARFWPKNNLPFTLLPYLRERIVDSNSRI